MGSKNNLQEYCQKNGIDLPLYSSNRMNNDRDHLPQWTANCNINGIQFKSKQYHTLKKSAEADAACVALEILKLDQKRENNQSLKLDTKKNNNIEHESILLNNVINKKFDSTNIEYIIIADIENISLLKLTAANNTLVVGFSCLSFHMIDKYLEKKWSLFASFVDFSTILMENKQYNLLTINDKISDLADHYLTAYLYHLVNKGCTQYKFVVLTNDHAGWCSSSVVKHIDNSIFIKNYSSLTVLKSEITNIIL